MEHGKDAHLDAEVVAIAGDLAQATGLGEPATGCWCSPGYPLGLRVGFGSSAQSYESNAHVGYAQ